MNTFGRQISFILALLAFCAVVSGETNGERPVRAAELSSEVEVIDPVAHLRAARGCTITYCFDKCPGRKHPYPC
ncbi:hypothetical protein GPALN_005930 [Globodera pallida]|nr:hypothetical protein GPALN_005930 [Globodera pallida]